MVRPGLGTIKSGINHYCTSHKNTLGAPPGTNSHRTRACRRLEQPGHGPMDFYGFLSVSSFLRQRLSCCCLLARHVAAQTWHPDLKGARRTHLIAPPATPHTKKPPSRCSAHGPARQLSQSTLIFLLTNYLDNDVQRRRTILHCKQVIFGEDARKKLADGINSVADAVKVGRKTR